MNSTANIVNSPNLPVAGRNQGNGSTSNEEEQSQVRFAEVLRGKQASHSDEKKDAKSVKDEDSAADPAGSASSGPDATAADGAAMASNAAAPAPTADPAIAALLLDPARVPATRAASPGAGGIRTTVPDLAGGDAATSLQDSPQDAAAAMKLAPAFPAIPGAGVPSPAGDGGLQGAAAGVRSDTRRGAVPLDANFESARGASAANRAQLPFGMAADSAIRSNMPASDLARTDAAPWAAFAVPVDTAASRQAAPAPLPPIEAPVGSPRFVDETAQQVTWLVKNGLSEAEIRVKPADMGPISVRIEMNQNEATISFAVTQPETRAAVQDSLHRLTEMLADSGISLGEANVGGQNFTQQSRDGNASGRSRVTFVPGRGEDAIAGAASGRRVISAGARGLVDTFA